MATVTATTQLTLAELAKRKDPNGQMAAIAEILSRVNPILTDMPMIEANGETIHKIVRRLSLPSGTWRRINKGVAKEASRTREVLEGIGMLESYAENDKALIDLQPNPTQARMDENASFIEGLSQELADTIFYGNTGTAPQEIDGFATRMGSLNADDNVIGAGGTGSDVTSIYGIGWGASRVFGIYPRNHPTAGIEHEDLGQVTLLDSSSNPYEGYRDHFLTKIGIAVKDPRYMFRYANIESAGSSNIFDEDELIRLITRVPSTDGMVLYVNATLVAQMQIRLKDKSNVNFTPGDGEGLAGQVVVRFMGIPVKKSEAIKITEDAIS